VFNAALFDRIFHIAPFLVIAGVHYMQGLEEKTHKFNIFLFYIMILSEYWQISCVYFPIL